MIVLYDKLKVIPISQKYMDKKLKFIETQYNDTEKNHEQSVTDTQKADIPAFMPFIFMVIILTLFIAAMIVMQLQVFTVICIPVFIHILLLSLKWALEDAAYQKKEIQHDSNIKENESQTLLQYNKLKDRRIISKILKHGKIIAFRLLDSDMLMIDCKLNDGSIKKLSLIIDKYMIYQHLDIPVLNLKTNILYLPDLATMV